MIDQEKIHNQCLSEDLEERIKALEQLKSNFSLLPDRDQAWNDLHILVNDKESDVRLGVVFALGSVFSDVPDKQKAWNDLHKLTTDEESAVRYSAVNALGSAFSHVPDKQKVWNDLIKLTNDQESDLRSSAAYALGSAFSHVPDKQKAWNDLIKLANDKEIRFTSNTHNIFRSIFSLVPDKQKAWKNIIQLANDKGSSFTMGAHDIFNYVFPQVPDKQQAWNDLIQLGNNKESNFIFWAHRTYGSVFPQVPDKQQAWNDLIQLGSNKESDFIFWAKYTYSSVFPQVPDKQQAWNDLIRLVNDKESRFTSAQDIFSSVFRLVPDKQKAWSDLTKLASSDEDHFISLVLNTYSSVFPQVPDKQQAWSDLHRFANNKNKDVRYNVAKALGFVFAYVQDKDQAWNDLHKFVNDINSDVRCSAVKALGLVLSDLPDKDKAWNDLHKLTADEDSYVRARVASTLGSIFSQVPNKQQTWNDLIRLTNDKETKVRTYANHSLGKISIYKASQVEIEIDYKKELENAIEFFEKAARESKYSSQSQFCLPFYRSFHAIIFKKQDAKEIDKYLAEAKDAIEGSKSKESLFEAVNNLANALKEVKNLENLDLETKKGELDFYRKYCDRAAELMIDAEEKAPFATIAMRKGLPILDRKLKELLEEIQKKAKIACQVSQGTPTQEIACAVSKEVQNWGTGSQKEITFNVESFIFTLELKIPKLPENEHIFKMINESKDQKDINKLLENASELIEIIPEITIDPERMKPTIGIITALPKEYAAVNVLLENKNDKYKIPGSGAGRRYCLGEILSEEGNKHNLVLATAGMGNNIAATRASLLLEHFPNVKSIIMVGIAGGVPNPCKDKIDDHVRLGDIVVSNENGVIQYDLIKQEIQEITHRNPPRPPGASLLEAVGYLEAEEILGNRPWEKYIVQALSQLKIGRPSDDKDILYDSCNQDEAIPHPKDPKRIKGQPRVFTGPIASANILQKDPNARDKLREKFKVKAIEMEASGIADATWNHDAGYLVVRGVCDYCDSHKNDDWQQYAAVVAAAYTRALIESMP